MKSLNHLSRSYDKNVILGHMVKNTGFDHLVYIQVSITWFIYRSRSFGSYIGLDHLVHVQVSTIWFIYRSRPFGLFIGLAHLVPIQVSVIWLEYTYHLVIWLKYWSVFVVIKLSSTGVILNIISNKQNILILELVLESFIPARPCLVHLFIYRFRPGYLVNIQVVIIR